MAGTDPVVIEVALHELVAKSTNPNVPYGPDEVAADALACRDAGASFLHFHARDPVTGEQRWHDDALYADAVARMRASGLPADLPWYPTYPGLRPGTPVAESMRHVAALAGPPVDLRLAAVDVGSFNLASYDPDARRFVGDTVKQLPHALFGEFAAFCSAHGLRPYLGLYEPGHLRAVAAYLDLGWVSPPLVCKLFFSEHHPYNLPPVPRSVETWADLFRTVLPGVEVTWFVQCYGHGLPELARAALDAGGHVRVGLGDHHPWDRPDRAGGTPTNRRLVEDVVRLAAGCGRPPAGVAEARRLLGLDQTT